MGYGTIGRGVAERAFGLKMRVCAVDAFPPSTKPPELAWIGAPGGHLGGVGHNTGWVGLSKETF